MLLPNPEVYECRYAFVNDREGKRLAEVVSLMTLRDIQQLLGLIEQVDRRPKGAPPRDIGKDLAQLDEGLKRDFGRGLQYPGLDKILAELANDKTPEALPGLLGRLRKCSANLRNLIKYLFEGEMIPFPVSELPPFLKPVAKKAELVSPKKSSAGTASILTKEAVFERGNRLWFVLNDDPSRSGSREKPNRQDGTAHLWLNIENEWP